MNKSLDIVDTFCIGTMLILILLSSYLGHSSIKETTLAEFERMQNNLQNSAYAQKLMFADLQKQLQTTEKLLQELHSLAIENQRTELELTKHENKLLRRELDKLKKRK